MIIPAADRWWRGIYGADAVRVYVVDLVEDGAREVVAEKHLDGDELQRCRQFEFPGPKRRFALCRAALRSLVCEQLGCRNSDLNFGSGKIGKPFAIIRDQSVDLSFNVSHSGDFGMIAIGGQRRMGVDIEQRRVRRDFDLLISTVFAEEERMEIESSDDDRKSNLFFDYWTVKEAILKAVGVGMTGIDPADIVVPVDLRRGQRSSIANFPLVSEEAWRIENLGNSRYAATLAYEIGGRN